jgi:hypothetical protein
MLQIGSFSLFLSNWLRNSSAFTAVFVAFSTSLNPKEPSVCRTPFASPFCVPLTVSYGVRKILFAKILLQRWRGRHFLCQLDSSPRISRGMIYYFSAAYPILSLTEFSNLIIYRMCHTSEERYLDSFTSI